MQTRIKQQGFTQKQVQEILGWGKSYLSGLLNAKVALRVEHLLLVCDVIGASPTELFETTEAPRDSSPEEDVAELLKSFEHPIHVLGNVDEEALLEAARRRLPRTRGVRRRYLADVVAWCENSIELNRRSEQRRARTRASGSKKARRAPQIDGPLEWPDFEDYVFERYPK
ncbi:MAG: helix-turn-helix transcriptional regulator [bacterium]|nr:helix-turn-helix transcriptional regulator [bacterium]